MTTNLKVPGRKSWTQRLRNEMAANWQLYLLVLLPVVYLNVLDDDAVQKP